MFSKQAKIILKKNESLYKPKIIKFQKNHEVQVLKKLNH